MAIRGYRGDLPAECCICFEEGSRARILIETTCCRASSVADRMIPKTYHRDCLRKWASQKMGDRFSCINCQRVLPKSPLFSKIERIKQCFHSKILISGICLAISAGSVMGLTLRSVKKEHFVFETTAWGLALLNCLGAVFLIKANMIKTGLQANKQVKPLLALNVLLPLIMGGFGTAKALTSWNFFQNASNMSSIYILNVVTAVLGLLVR